MEKRTQKREVQATKVVLMVIAIAGVMSLAAVAPGAMLALKPFIGNKRRYRTPRYVEGVIGKLQKRGLVTFVHEHGKTLAQLTEKGRREIMRYQLQEASHAKKRWDGKWRLVIFDIHEFKRGTRDHIREAIARFGFLKLQNSVWVYPYDCEELITLIKADCHIGQEVLYIISERIENDTWLKKKFGLSHEQ